MQTSTALFHFLGWNIKTRWQWLSNSAFTPHNNFTVFQKEDGTRTYRPDIHMISAQNNVFPYSCIWKSDIKVGYIHFYNKRVSIILTWSPMIWVQMLQNTKGTFLKTRNNQIYERITYLGKQSKGQRAPQLNIQYSIYWSELFTINRWCRHDWWLNDCVHAGYLLNIKSAPEW